MSDAQAGELRRHQMVERQLRARGIRDERVLAAMDSVPREEFVPPSHVFRAYDDCALPLAHGQTISQPYMVARTIELARVGPDDIVLEVGLGSGYQAAVLARLCARVFGIELLPELAASARAALARISTQNVEVLVGDGSLGHADAAPYDAIVVAASAPGLPPSLVDQLKLHGRLVIPIRNAGVDKLTVVERTQHGLTRTEHESCVYVPLRGAAGWADDEV